MIQIELNFDDHVVMIVLRDDTRTRRSWIGSNIKTSFISFNIRTSFISSSTRSDVLKLPMNKLLKMGRNG